MSTFKVVSVLFCFTLAAAAIAAGIMAPYQESWMYGAGLVVLGIGFYLFAEAMIARHERLWGWLRDVEDERAPRWAYPRSHYYVNRKGRVSQEKLLWLNDGLEPEWDWPAK